MSENWWAEDTPVSEAPAPAAAPAPSGDEWWAGDEEVDNSSASGDLKAGVETAKTFVPGMRAARGVDLIEDAQGEGSITGLDREARGYMEEARALEVELPKLSGDDRQTAVEEIGALREKANQRNLLAGTPSAKAKQEDLDERAVAGVKILMDNLPKITEGQAAAAAIPMNPSAREFVSPEGDGNLEQLGSMWDSFADDPTGVARTFALRSLPGSAPSIIAAIAGQAVAGPAGAAAFSGLIGGSTELGASAAQFLGESLQEAGVDVSDPAAVEAWALDNMPDLLEAIGKARTRAAVIGAGSAASAGVVGGIARTAANARRPITGELAGTVVEGVSEGGTEALAQVASGDELAVGEVGAEVVGGTATGAPQTAGQIAIEASRRRSNGELSPDQAAALGNADPAPTATQGAPAADVAPDVSAALNADKPNAAGATRDVLSEMRQPTPQPPIGPNAATDPAATPAEPPVAPAVPPAPAPEPAPPVEPAPAGPEVTPEGNFVPPEGDTPVEPETVPEADETIEAQREALVAGKKKAVLYTPGTVLPPELDTKRFNRVNIAGVGIIDYDKKQITGQEIRALAKFGKLNEVLELGPYNKQDVAQSIAAGSPEVAVVEQTPDGTEVKAAAGTQETAPEQIAALEETKTAPENEIVERSPAQVLSDRLAARQVPEAAPAPAQAPTTAPAAPATAKKPTRTKAELIAALEEQEARVAARTPSPAPETIPDPTTETTPPETTTAETTTPAAPEAAENETVTPAGYRAEVTEGPDGKRVVKLKPNEGVAERTQDFNEDIRANIGAEKAKEVSKVRKEKRVAEKGGERNERLETVKKEIAEGKHKTPAEQARALSLAGGANLSKKAVEKRMDDATMAAELQKQFVPDQFEQVTTREGKESLTRDLKAIKALAEQMGFRFTRTAAIDTDAVVWLKDVDTLLKKLESDKISYSDLNSRLAGWTAAKSGVSDIIRDTRREEGDAAKRKTGTTENLAAASPVAAEEKNADSIDTVTDEDQGDDAGLPTSNEDSDDVTAKVTKSRQGAKLSDGSEKATLKIRGVEQEVDRAQASEVRKVEMTDEEKKALAAKYFSSKKSERPGRKSNYTKDQIDDWIDTLNPAQLEFLTALSQENARLKLPPGTAFYDLPQDSIKKLWVELGFDDKFGPEQLFSTRKVLLKDVFRLMVSPNGKMGIEEAAFSAGQGRWGTLQNEIGSGLLKSIIDIVGDVEVHFVDSIVAEDVLQSGAVGWYSDTSDTIALDEYLLEDNLELAKTVVHEAAHAAFANLIETVPDVKAAIDTLRTYVRVRAQLDDFKLNRGEPNEDYWDTNAHEFISEVFGNPEFQEYLAKVPLLPGQVDALGIPKTGGRVKTALDAIKAKLLQILKFPKNRFNVKSAFEVAMDITAHMIENSAASRARHAVDRDLYFNSPFGGAYASKTPKREPNRKPLKVHTLEARLEWRGLDGETAKEIAETIRSEFEGKATNIELDAIVKRITGEAPKVTREGKRMEHAAEAHHQRTITQIREQGEKMAEQAMGIAEKEFVPGKNPGRPKLLRVLTNYQIAEIADRFFGKSNNPVRKIAEITERRRVLKARNLKEMTPVVEELMAAQKRHTPETWSNFLSLAHDTTMANVHPDRSLEENAHLGKNRLDTTWNKAQHAALAARYDALPQDLKDLYADTRDSLTDTQNRMTRMVIENILSHPSIQVDDPGMVQRFHEGKPTAEDKAAVGVELASHLERATELQKIEGPYFNLVRRGDFVVQGTYKIDTPPAARKVKDNVFEFTSKDEAVAFAQKTNLRTSVKSIWVDKNTGSEWATDDDGVEVKIVKQDNDAENRFRVTVQNRHVEFADTRADALRRAKQLNDAGLMVKDIEPKRYERTAQNAEMLSDQMRAIAATIEKRSATSELSKKQQEEMRQTLNEISLRFLGSTRIQSSRLERKYVEGASQDLTKNTFEYVESASGYLARLETAPRLEQALEQLETRVSALGQRGTGSAEGARMISYEVERRVYRAMPDEDDGFINNGVTRLTNIAFIDALASPAYSLINATQVGMFSLPVLSADFNAVGATAAIVKAYRDLGAKSMLAAGIGDTGRAAMGKTVTGDRHIDDVKGRLSNKLEIQMIDDLADSGLIDADGGMEISRILSRRDGTLGGKFDLVLQKTDNLVRAIPQAVEAVNRTTTALAAFRLMYAKTKDYDAALQYAKDTVNDTQALMSNSNAAPIFSHPIGRISLQFKKFGQMAYYLLGKNIGRVINPMEKGERVKGMKTLAYITATHATFAGTVGLPGLEALKIGMMLFNGAMSAMGAGLGYEWEDFEEDVEKYMAALTGSETRAKMVTYGVTRGIPGGWGFDLNSRLGMDSLLLFGEPRGDSAEDYKAYLWDTFTGPIGRTTADAVSGAMSALGGDPSDLGKVIPFKMVSDVGSALSKGAEGTMNTQDMILRTIGLMSGRQADIYQDVGVEIRERQRANSERDGLVSEYLSARSAEDLRAARIKIQKFNRSTGKSGQRTITTKGLDEIRRKEQRRYRD